MGQLGFEEEGISFRILRSDDTSARISETSCLMVLISLKIVEEDMWQGGIVAVVALPGQEVWGVDDGGGEA